MTQNTKKVAAPATKPAEADKLAPATEPTESGALMEDTIKERIDLGHPAVDDQPRKGLPPESNQIDFNDPRSAREVQKEAAASAEKR
jgi:hypothetical protein